MRLLHEDLLKLHWFNLPTQSRIETESSGDRWSHNFRIGSLFNVPAVEEQKHRNKKNHTIYSSGRTQGFIFLALSGSWTDAIFCKLH